MARVLLARPGTSSYCSKWPWDIPQVRPPVLSPASRDGLDKYRAFRHIVRNVYAFRFNPVRIGQLVDSAGSLYAQVRAELLGFADFLDARAEG